VGKIDQNSMNTCKISFIARFLKTKICINKNVIFIGIFSFVEDFINMGKIDMNYILTSSYSLMISSFLIWY